MKFQLFTINILLMWTLLPLILFSSENDFGSIDSNKLEDLYTRADNGDAESQFELFFVLRDSENEEIRNFGEAIRYLEKAAEQRHPKACQVIASMHTLGKVVPPDYTKAIKFAKVAVEEGNLNSSFLIGTIYNELLNDPKESISWYELAAENNDTLAAYKLGLLYCFGKGVDQDLNRGREWLIKAANQQHARSQKMLGVIYSLGKGVDRDITKALRWTLAAAENGDDSSQMMIGTLFFSGEGLEKNNVLAYKWLKISSSNGNEDAKKELADLIGKLSPQEIAKGQSLAEDWLNTFNPRISN